MNKLVVKKRWGSDVYHSGTDWKWQLLDIGALKVTTKDEIILYAPGEWKSTHVVSERATT